MKQLNIAIWGYGNPVLELLPILKRNNINVIYIKLDKLRNNSSDIFVDELKRLHIEYFVDNYPEIQLDMIFVCNYNKIIPNNVLEKYLFVNYHIGLLPKWRGNSANGWAIINGENYVGYSIHQVVPMLDAGSIYYQYKYPYDPNETYFNARQAMNSDFHNNISNILKNIAERNIVMNNNYSEDFVYCCKFRPIDGVITDWNITTENLIRKFYVFAPPLGTGLKFYFKNKIYEIQSLSKIDSFAESIGIPGSVVYLQNNSVWIKTKDTVVSLDKITCNGEIVDIPKTFVISQRLI